MEQRNVLGIGDARQEEFYKPDPLKHKQMSVGQVWLTTDLAESFILSIS